MSRLISMELKLGNTSGITKGSLSFSAPCVLALFQALLGNQRASNASWRRYLDK